MINSTACRKKKAPPLSRASKKTPAPRTRKIAAAPITQTQYSDSDTEASSPSRSIGGFDNAHAIAALLADQLDVTGVVDPRQQFESPALSNLDIIGIDEFLHGGVPPCVLTDDSEEEDGMDANFEDAEKDLGMKHRLVNTRTLPSVPVLYGLNREICGQSESSEKTSKCVFAWHSLICSTTNRKAFTDPKGLLPGEKVGLGLYRPSAFTASTSDCKAYDTKFLGEAFAFLSTYATANIMKKAITFYNAHLRAEYRIRMMAAGNPSAANGDAKVGQNSDVKKYLNAALGKRASQAMERCDDLHSAVDTHITDVEIHRKCFLVALAEGVTLFTHRLSVPQFFIQRCFILYSNPNRRAKWRGWMPSTASTLLRPFALRSKMFVAEMNTTVNGWFSDLFVRLRNLVR